MQLNQRLQIQRVKLGWKFPETVNEVAVAENDAQIKKARFPTGEPVILELGGTPSIVALHSFSDGDVWLVRLQDYSEDWVTIRQATGNDKRAIWNRLKLESLFPVNDYQLS